MLSVAVQLLDAFLALSFLAVDDLGDLGILYTQLVLIRLGGKAVIGGLVEDRIRYADVGTNRDDLFDGQIIENADVVGAVAALGEVADIQFRRRSRFRL